MHAWWMYARAATSSVDVRLIDEKKSILNPELIKIWRFESEL
jgi:hypothetical protein